MTRRLWLALGLIFVFYSLLPAGFGRQKVAAAQGSADVLQLVNQMRSSYGLAAFEFNGSLAAAAQSHANWMAATNIYSHSGAGGSSPQSRAAAAGYPGYVAENIVGGTALTPQQGVTWWQNSPSHFNAMISNRYTQAGVGYAVGFDQNFYVLVVGNPSNTALAAARETTDADNAPIFVAPIVLSQPGEDGSIVHVAQDGHTFWAIAARYEVSLAELFLFNNLTENDTLQPGDELIIRLAEGQAPPPTPTPPASHMVRSGDTVWTIAAWYKVSVADLLWLNGLEEESLLHPGDEIAIRLLEGQTPPPTPTPQIAHIVQSGDTAWSIALLYGLTLDELLAFNGLGPNPLLHPGDELLIRPPTPLPTATNEATATAAPPATDAALSMSSSSTATFTPQATPSLTPSPLPPSTPTPTGGGQSAGQSIFLGTVIAGLGLTALAGAVTVVLKRQNL